MRRRIRSALLALLIAGSASSASAQTITVSAAASLRDAFNEIGMRFERERPGAKVVFNFAASGVLLQQLRQGAPVDVLATADQEVMNRAANEQWILADSRRDFARNTLVVIVPRQATQGGTIAAPHTLAELSRLTRIAIGNSATVPAGRYAQQALQAAGVALNNVIPAENVRQVLVYVARAEVDAGFVYRSDVAQEAARVQVAFTVPLANVITYPIAVVRHPRRSVAQTALARAFVQTVQSAQGRAILLKHGFELP